MASVQARQIAAVVGAIVADAAAQPLHWVYNPDTLLQLIGTKQSVEFHDPAGNPFYRIDNGRNSCYGDQTYVLLKSLVKNKGFSKEDFIEDTYKFFGPGSEYDLSYKPNDREQLYSKYGPKSANAEKDEKKRSLPISGPWKHSCLKDFEENYNNKKEELGSDSLSLDCVVRNIPLVALYAGKPDLLERVEEALRIIQNSDLAVAVALASARILEYCILKGKIDGVVDQVLQDLRDPDRSHPQDLDSAVAGQLQAVLNQVTKPHIKVARETFKIS